MNARQPPDSTPANPLREDRPVTIQQLRASSRVRFWVPAQLMDEFFGAAPRVAAPTQPIACASHADECVRPAFACAAAR